jgi:arylsulfatase
VPLFKDPAASWPERYLVTHVGRWPAGTDVANSKPAQTKYANCSIRWKNYHAVRSGGKASAADAWQLFDLAADPGEKNDIADKHPNIVKQLDTEYDRWWAAAVPNMVNESAAATAAKLKFTPYKELYWNQFRGPGPNNIPPPPDFGK